MLLITDNFTRPIGNTLFGRGNTRGRKIPGALFCIGGQLGHVGSRLIFDGYPCGLITPCASSRSTKGRVGSNPTRCTFPWPKGGLMPQGRSIPTSRDSTTIGTRIESVMPAILLRGGVNFMGRSSCLGSVDGSKTMNVWGPILKCAPPNMDAGVPAVRVVVPGSTLPRDNQS